MLGGRVPRLDWRRQEQSLLFERERIYELGLSVEEVARTAETGISGRRAGYFREAANSSRSRSVSTSGLTDRYSP